jgi:hypothetical protein
MSNVVFIPTSNLYRVSTLIKYYNVHNEPTDQRVIFIGDDRGDISKKEYADAVNDSRFELIYMSDMLEAVNDMFADCPYYDAIINNMFRVSVKMVVFIYAASHMGIHKSLMLDDDILFLKPLDEWFKYDYVVKEDGLSNMSESQVTAFQRTYPHIDIFEFNKPKHRINSGSILYTMQDDSRLLNDVRAFFSSDEIYYILVNRLNKTTSRRKGWGYDWLLEQYFYGIHMYSLGVEIPRFRSAVNISLGYPKEDKPSKPFKKIPNVIHFLQMEKQRMYDAYLPLIDSYLEINNYNNTKNKSL